MSLFVLLILLWGRWGGQSLEVDEYEILKRAERFPMKNAGLDGFKPPPECANSKVVMRAEGYFSKTVAFVLNRNSYRGFDGFLTYDNCFHLKMRDCKEEFEWRESAHAIQMATNKAFLAHVVEPMEVAGFTVHIFLHTFLCAHCSPEVNATYTNDLITSLGRHRIRDVGITPPLPNRGQGQSSAMVHTFSALRREFERGVRYRSVLIWRWDMVPLFPLAAPREVMIPLLETYKTDPKISFVRAHRHLPHHYLMWSSTDAGVVVGDQIFSVPGWQLPCYFPVILNDSTTSTKMWWHQGQHPLEWESIVAGSRFITGHPPRHQYELFDRLGLPSIYRGPYGMSHNDAGKPACRLLRDMFEGPSCGAWEEARDVCSLIRAEGMSDARIDATLELIWDHMASEDLRREEDDNQRNLLKKLGLKAAPDEFLSKAQFMVKADCRRDTTSEK